MRELDDLHIDTERNGLDEQDLITAVLCAEDTRWTVRGRVGPRVPLRHRRDDGDGQIALTRIVEGLTTWTRDDGRVAHGMSDYLDQIADGRPVGLAV